MPEAVPHTSLRKTEGEALQKAEEQQLKDAQTLATPEAQAELKSSQTLPNLSSTGSEEGETL